MKTKLAAVVTEDIFELLEPPALWPCEDVATYRKFLTQAMADLRPTDIVGHMLVKNLVDQMFEIVRYRRIQLSWMEVRFAQIKVEKISTLSAEMSESPTHQERLNIELKLESIGRRRPGCEWLNEEGLKKQLTKLNIEEDNRLARTYERRENAKASVTTQGEFVAVLATWLEECQALERIRRAAEEQFSITRAQLERHHHGLGRRLRERFDELIEGEIVPFVRLAKTSA